MDEQAFRLSQHDLAALFRQDASAFPVAQRAADRELRHICVISYILVRDTHFDATGSDLSDSVLRDSSVSVRCDRWHHRR